MAKINSAPSPKAFVETWSTDFKAAVEKAAGKDGRLSLAEAKKIAKSVTGDAMFADTVEKFFTQTGQKSASVGSIVNDMKVYATRAAEQAAGGDGKISLADGNKLPADLKDDFFFLRGKTVPATTPTTTGPLSVAELKTKLTALTADMLMPSETDAKFEFVNGGQLNGAAVDAAAVRAKLTPVHDATIGSLMYVPAGTEKLSTRNPSEVRDGSQYLQHIIDAADQNDPDSLARAEQFKTLKSTLETNLTDLKVIRFGDVNISTFIVGRAKTGELVGLLTGQVET
jgi:hypothetical protein